MTTTGRTNNGWLFQPSLLLLVLFIGLLFLNPASADPTGAEVVSNSTDYGPINTPGQRADNRSTITTMVLNVVQQDQYWKAYVGNVTGVLTLDDGNDFTIYDWSLTGVTITGEVYASRFNSITIAGIGCADDATILSEQTALNMTTTQIDNINRTFNYSEHDSFYVGPYPINESICRTAITYINDTPQADAVASYFHEVLLEDGANQLVYTAIIENNHAGYHENMTYDFQMLVGESGVETTPKTYYFFTEIAS